MTTACSEARAVDEDETSTAATRKLSQSRPRGEGVAGVKGKPSRAGGRAPALGTPQLTPPS